MIGNDYEFSQFSNSNLKEVGNPFHDTVGTNMETSCNDQTIKDNSKSSEDGDQATITTKKGKWSPQEDAILREVVPYYGAKHWKKIAEHVEGRNAIQCLHRWTKILQPGLVKGPWTVEEDKKLIEWVKREGPHKWSQCSQYIPGRNGKQCRDRWYNNLNPEIKKGGWNQEEDNLIFQLYHKFGSQWSKIATFFNGRTENAIKNRFYSTLRRISNEKAKKLKSEQAAHQLKDNSTQFINASVEAILHKKSNEPSINMRKSAQATTVVTKGRKRETPTGGHSLEQMWSDINIILKNDNDFQEYYNICKDMSLDELQQQVDDYCQSECLSSGNNNGNMSGAGNGKSRGANGIASGSLDPSSLVQLKQHQHHQGQSMMLPRIGVSNGFDSHHQSASSVVASKKIDDFYGDLDLRPIKRQRVEPLDPTADPLDLADFQMPRVVPTPDRTVRDREELSASSSANLLAGEARTLLRAFNASSLQSNNKVNAVTNGNNSIDISASANMLTSSMNTSSQMATPSSVQLSASNLASRQFGGAQSLSGAQSTTGAQSISGEPRRNDDKMVQLLERVTQLETLLKWTKNELLNLEGN
eukprot:CAMPEP_0115004196 /NCGR_PEP_ID=MMETSP0216-20121206/19055_1 /TAXON_ID=223996 /ORGANISM="Protocruzia adherens, Strain Boccale" /LENGTH=584 /DNA_ID=CAMNT_0002370131 /DNA_START=68 /DNA_END=1822 /DNA_ORIENTATION=-